MNQRALGICSVLGLLFGSSFACGGSDSIFSSTSTATGTSSSAGGASTSSGTGGTGGNSTSTTGSTGGMGGTGGTMSTGGMTTGGTGGTGGSVPPPLYDCTAPSGAAGNLKLTQVVGSLQSPVLVKSAPDDPDRLYIVQQTGKVRIFQNGQTLATPFIDVASLIVAGGEQGLLGLAFHPDYATNGRFFLHYSSVNQGESTIQEFKRSAADPLVADPSPVQLVVKHPTAQSNHNGGSIEFGQDGYLYIALGDGGNQNDPECDAQNLQNLLGKITRLDVNGVPDANGYPAAPGNNGKPYHIGFRNPWRMSVDLCTGDLYIGDVGQNQYEEIDVAKTNPPAPKNFGWPYREGLHPHNNSNCPAPDPNAWTDPIAEYDHGLGCSVTGGYVYRSSAIPWLRGTYFYADYCSSRVWMVHYTNGVADAPVIVNGVSQTVGNISSFGQDGRGNVYVVVHTGSIHRIDPG